MKNYHILAAAALLTLAACSKNEVRPASSDPQEITFQTVVGPQTKALSSTQSSFGGDKFKSYAWFLPQGKTWAQNSADAEAYISDAEISSNSKDANGKKIWKDANHTYYWPKQGSLTFFSWTLLEPATTNPAPAAFDKASVTCTATKGIEVKDYDVSVNKNYDLMVADIAADKTKNENTYETDGVPTLFHHVLSNLAFKVKTNKAYTANEKFAMKSITLKNVMTKGNYTQGSATAKSPEDVWSAWSETKEMQLANNTDAVEFTNDGQDNNIAITDYSIVLPQKFTDENPKIEIVYEITTNYTGTAVTETVTVERPLKDIYKDNWVAGKKYTLTITIGLDEIRWDPAVENWESIDGGTITL